MTIILVAEDDPALRQEIIDTLAFGDSDVLPTANGRAALESARRNAPDLIISDVMMPELDGYGLLLALQEDVATARIPFIFLTGKADYADIRKGMAFGADDYLIKPFRPMDLLDAVQTRLAKQAEAQRRLEQHVSELRNTIVTAMPHELRTPLTGIMGYLDLMLSDFERFNPQQILQMLSTMRRSSERLYRLIQNYLLFAQLEIIGLDQQKIALIAQYKDLKATNPAEVLNTVARQKAAQHNRPGDLRLQVVPGAIHLLPEDLQKITDELIDNAFKFSAPGTAVTITGEIVDSSYLIGIVDQGRGMRSDQLKQIDGLMQFDRRIQEQQGMGLGLVIARRLTEIYGGQFAIESEAEKGTSVYLRFKAAGSMS